MRENIKYMLKNWIAWDKKSLVYFLIRVPALVFQPIVTAYIPKAMIDCIEKGVTTRQLILVVALLQPAADHYHLAGSVYEGADPGRCPDRAHALCGGCV